jgi:hypothetical protein
MFTFPVPGPPPPSLCPRAAAHGSLRRQPLPGSICRCLWFLAVIFLVVHISGYSICGCSYLRFSHALREKCIHMCMRADLPMMVALGAFTYGVGDQSGWTRSTFTFVPLLLQKEHSGGDRCSFAPLFLPQGWWGEAWAGPLGKQVLCRGDSCEKQIARTPKIVSCVKKCRKLS